MFLFLQQNEQRYATVELYGKTREESMARKMINWISPGMSPFWNIGSLYREVLKLFAPIVARSSMDISSFKTLNSIIISR